MKERIARTLLTTLVAGAVCFTAAPADTGGMTVGEFLHQVALSRNLPATDGPVAERLLRLDGVDLPVLDLTDRITEGMVVAISGSLGLEVSSSRPGAAFDAASMGPWLDLLPATESSTRPSTRAGDPGPYPRPNDRAADPRTKGKGKKKGLPPVSESSPI